MPSMFVVILALSAAAGTIDAIAYFELGRIFVANMTGNTVLGAGLILAGKWTEAGRHLVTVVTFLLGIIGARSVVARSTPPQPGSLPYRWRVAACLITSAGFVMASTVLASRLHGALVPLLAFCLGAQNTVLTRWGPATFKTSFITGDLEKLGESVAQFGKRRAGPGATPRFQAAISGAIWLCYFLGAAAGAGLAREFHVNAFSLPALILVGAAALVATGAG
jgi:uncharacterized membrane protein YoaK (UPF0700 family)